MPNSRHEDKKRLVEQIDADVVKRYNNALISVFNVEHAKPDDDRAVNLIVRKVRTRLAEMKHDDVIIDNAYRAIDAQTWFEGLEDQLQDAFPPDGVPAIGQDDEDTAKRKAWEKIEVWLFDRVASVAETTKLHEEFSIFSIDKFTS